MDKDFMDTFALAVVALFVLTFGLVLRCIQKTIISTLMVSRILLNQKDEERRNAHTA